MVLRPLSQTTTVRRALLVSGILSSVLYAAMNVVAALQWPEYSSASQTVSELSAIGAPTRDLWIPLGALYMILFGAFAWSVRTEGRENPPLRFVGGLLLAFAASSLLWPFAPMHLRGAAFSLTDAVHIALGLVTVFLMLAAMGFGSTAFGKRFRIYSIVSVVLSLVFAILVAREAPGIAKNLPTPTIGVWERLNIAVFMLWVIVLSSQLLRRGVVAPKNRLREATRAA